MTNASETTRGRYRVRVEHDPHCDGDSPREFTTTGTLVLSHTRYTLPSEGDAVAEIHQRLSDEEFGATLEARLAALTAWLVEDQGATVVLPVWGYHHGQLRLKAGERTYPFDDRFDSGLLGVIYDTPDARAETGVTAEAMAEALAAEVSEYDTWSNNEMYCYVVERRDDDGDQWEEVEAVYGYFSEKEARHAGETALTVYAPTARAETGA